jgi:hypothetical protein
MKVFGGEFLWKLDLQLFPLPSRLMAAVFHSMK